MLSIRGGHFARPFPNTKGEKKKMADKIIDYGGGSRALIATLPSRELEILLADRRRGPNTKQAIRDELESRAIEASRIERDGPKRFGF
jgi:hypothetical protein